MRPFVFASHAVVQNWLEELNRVLLGRLADSGRRLSFAVRAGRGCRGSDQPRAEKRWAVTMASASTSIGKELWSGPGPRVLTR